MRFRSSPRRSLPILIAFALIGGVGACTIWNDLSVESAVTADAGRDATSTHVADSSMQGDDDGETSTSDGGGLDAAKDADTGAPLSSYLSIDDATHACVLIERCSNLGASIEHSLGLPFGDTNFSSCMTLLAGPIPPVRAGDTPKSMMSCVSNAGSCTQAGQCLPIELIAADDTRCVGVHDDAGLGVCKDGDLLNCDPAYETQIFHCSNEGYAAGSSCMVSTSGQNLQCATMKGCNTPYTACSGEVLSVCYGDTTPDYLTSSRNCTVSGETCGTVASDAGPITDCISEGQDLTCDSTMVEGAITCSDAGVISSCGNFYSMIFDCRQLGATCATNGSSAYCHRATDDCSPYDQDVNTCAGSILTICLDGKKTTVDCSSAGASCMSGGADAPSFCK